MAIQGWTLLKISSFLAHPSPGASLKSAKSSHDVLFELETHCCLIGVQNIICLMPDHDRSQESLGPTRHV